MFVIRNAASQVLRDQLGFALVGQRTECRTREDQGVRSDLDFAAFADQLGLADPLTIHKRTVGAFQIADRRHVTRPRDPSVNCATRGRPAGRGRYARRRVRSARVPPAVRRRPGIPGVPRWCCGTSAVRRVVRWEFERSPHVRRRAAQLADEPAVRGESGRDVGIVACDEDEDVLPGLDQGKVRHRHPMLDRRSVHRHRRSREQWLQKPLPRSQSIRNRSWPLGTSSSKTSAGTPPKATLRPTSNG